jgi:uncharacterized protein (UPF0276 family)
MAYQYPVQGAGLGLRRSLCEPLSSVSPEQVQFMEVAPENWINVGGRYGAALRSYTEKFPFVMHGLSLSIGSPSGLDWDLLRAIKAFIAEHSIRCYSEHLSYCSDSGHLYDLMPIPFTEEAIDYVAERIIQIRSAHRHGERLLLRRTATGNVRD